MKQKFYYVSVIYGKKKGAKKNQFYFIQEEIEVDLPVIENCVEKERPNSNIKYIEDENGKTYAESLMYVSVYDKNKKFKQENETFEEFSNKLYFNDPIVLQSRYVNKESSLYFSKHTRKSDFFYAFKNDVEFDNIIYDYGVMIKNNIINKSKNLALLKIGAKNTFYPHTSERYILHEKIALYPSRYNKGDLSCLYLNSLNKDTYWNGSWYGLIFVSDYLKEHENNVIFDLFLILLKWHLDCEDNKLLMNEDKLNKLFNGFCANFKTLRDDYKKYKWHKRNHYSTKNEYFYEHDIFFLPVQFFDFNSNINIIKEIISEISIDFYNHETESFKNQFVEIITEFNKTQNIEIIGEIKNG